MSNLITATLSGDGPKLRILVCHTCKAMVPIPDVPGGKGDDDMLVSRVMEHQFPPIHVSGNEIQTRPHEMILCRVPERLWNSPELRSHTIKEIQKHTGAGDGEGLGELYEVKSNFMEDAMRCWRFKHGRTSNCDDYRHDKMRLLPDSRAERKELGLDPARRPVQYLCQYCPVESIVQQRKNQAKGVDR